METENSNQEAAAGGGALNIESEDRGPASVPALTSCIL